MELTCETLHEICLEINSIKTISSNLTNMTSAFVSPFIDVGDVIIRQNLKLSQLRQQQQQNQSAERRNTIGAPVNIPRNRNFSIGNFTPVTGNNITPVIPMDNQMILNEHKKLDRSYSEPCDRTMNNNSNLNSQLPKQPAVNSSRYKTELCRPFEESGHCKYADKCQFAHGIHEMKQLQRHPKYKTELCRTFHSKGFCPYGPRCNFVHNDDVSKLNEKNNRVTAQAVTHQQQQQQHATQYFQHISPPGFSQSPPPMVQRPTSINFNSSYTGSLGSSADSSPPSSVGSESPSLSPVFFGEDAQLMNHGYLPMNNTLNFDNSTNGNVFNVMPELAHIDLTPLNIQTTTTDFLTQQFNALLNLNNQSNTSERLSAFDEWDSSLFTTQPPASPDSISGESIGSASSFSTSNTFSTCGSPMEAGKNFRLPVFNHISQD